MDTATAIADSLVYERFDKMGFQLQVEVWLCFKRCWRSLREPYLRSNRLSFQILKSIFNIWVTLKNIANQDISKKNPKCFILKLQTDFLSLNTYKSFFLNKTHKTLRKCTYLSITESPFFSRNIFKALTPVMCLATKNTQHPSFTGGGNERGGPVTPK